MFATILVAYSIPIIAQPVTAAAWTFGVSEEARGVSVESEVQIYDKDAWGDHLGGSFDYKANTLFGGSRTYANDVGSKSKSTINDFERDDIWFFGDYLMNSTVPTNTLGFTDYWSAVPFVHDTVASLAYENTTGLVIDPVNLTRNDFGAGATCGYMWIIRYVVAFFASNYIDLGYEVGTPLYCSTQVNNSYDLIQESTLTKEKVTASYRKTYKGYILERDKWDFTIDPFDSKPDIANDRVPFIEDPHDLHDSWYYFNGFLDHEFSLIDTIIESLLAIKTTLYLCKTESLGGLDGEAQLEFWEYLNSTIAKGLYVLIDDTKLLNYLALIGDPTVDLPALFIDALINETGENPIQELFASGPGIGYIEPYFRSLVPDKKEYLAELFLQGIPGMKPIEKYLEKVINDFDIDEDVYWGGTKKHKGGITVNERVVTIEYEWAQGVLGVDGVSQRENFKIEFTYASSGSQNLIEFKGSEVFYRIEILNPTAQIYTVILITIIVIASIAIIGIGYVILKKMRKKAKKRSKID
ncbi:MAG: hypothetical protein ACFFAH_02930 [Promethearchaeota archaeon]